MMNLTVFFYVLVAAVLGGCAVTSHTTSPAGLGQAPSTPDALAEIRKPGAVSLKAVTAAHWAVPRAGLLNLDHPRARKAGLEDKDERILIQFFELRHPTRGLYLIDSGVAAGFRSAETAPVGWLLQKAMNFEALEVTLDMRSWSEKYGHELRGIFLTHLHLDHVMGLPDLPKRVPLYTGPGEAAGTQFLNLFVQGTTDDFLDGFGSLREWRFTPDAQRRFAGIVDVFGDQTVFALHVPGHTPGSTAFLVRTPTGPELVVGDACHTAWGWENQVEPGSFSADLPRSAVSLHQLKALETSIPNLKVHLGHQHRTLKLAAAR